VKLKARLVAIGAVLPTVLVLAAVVLAGWLFRRAQRADLDHPLLTQAAVESVGMFDGPDGGPHVHLPRSPIAGVVEDFAPVSAVYDDHGALATTLADRRVAPERVPLAGRAGAVRLSEETIAGIRRRVLVLPVQAPDGRTYTLWLGASLAPIAATMTRFWTATLTAAGVVALLLFSIQIAVARRLAQRLAALTSFAPRLRDGDAALPSDPVRDEISELNAAIRDVAGRLAAARAEQDRLLASAAHELRTPLTVLRTAVDLALRKQRSADELRDSLREVREDLERLGGLASALLDLQAVRHIGFERTPGDLAALAREACAGFQVVADTRKIDLRLTVTGPAPVQYDERTLRQAIDNLIGNALRHAPPHSEIEVAVVRGQGSWQLSVTDRGPGVAPDHADRIFEPFQRFTAAAASGAGLGLAIAREVMARHDGRAWLDRDYFDGARFVLELPCIR